MQKIVAFGIFVLPAMASSIACLVMVALAAIFPQDLAHEGLRLNFLWKSALVVGVPASLLMTAIFAPLARTYRNSPKGYIIAGATLGLFLGVIGIVTVWGALFYIDPRQPQRTLPNDISALLATIAAITGLLSGAIFGLLANRTMRNETSPQVTKS